MFRFIVQDNQTYLVMRVSKKLYNSRLYHFLQTFCVAFIFVAFVQLCDFYGLFAGSFLGEIACSYDTYAKNVLNCAFSFYIMERVFALQMIRHKLDPVMAGFKFLFPSKMEWCLELHKVLQNKFKLFCITEVDTDPFCYYKPVLCFWMKGCYVCKGQHTP